MFFQPRGGEGGGGRREEGEGGGGHETIHAPSIGPV